MGCINVSVERVGGIRRYGVLVAEALCAAILYVCLLIKLY